MNPLFPIVGAIVAYMIAKNKGASGTNLLLWTFLGAIIGGVVAVLLLLILAGAAVKAIKNMNPAQAQTMAQEIADKETRIRQYDATKGNAYTSVEDFMSRGSGVEIDQLRQDVSNLKGYLASAGYSYQNGQAIKL